MGSDEKDVEYFELPVSLRIRGDISVVFNAWISPDIAANWLCDRMEGDWRPGMSVYWYHGDHKQEIKVEAIEKPKKLRFSWRAWGTQPETSVQVAFQSMGEEIGVKIHESCWSLSKENVSFALDHACGWENILCRLKAWIEHGVRL